MSAISQNDGNGRHKSANPPEFALPLCIKQGPLSGCLGGFVRIGQSKDFDFGQPHSGELARYSMRNSPQKKKFERHNRAPIHSSTHAWLVQVAMNVGSDCGRELCCFVVSNSLGKPGKQCDVACHRSPTYHYYMTLLFFCFGPSSTALLGDRPSASSKASLARQ